MNIVLKNNIFAIISALFWGGLSLLRVGVYLQVEAFIIGVFLVVGITAFFNTYKNNDSMSITPLGYCYALGIGYATAQLLWVENFFTHLHGLPPTFESLAWLGVGFITSAFFSYRAHIFRINMIFLIFILVITVINHPTLSWSVWPQYVPYTFLSYVGLIGALIIGFSEFAKCKKKSLIYFTLGVIAILFSTNKTAICSLVFYFGVYVLFRYTSYKNMAKIIVISSPLTILILEIGLNYYFDLGTLAERVIGAKIIAFAFIDNPWIILFGKGFGTYPDLVQQYLYDLPMSYYTQGRQLSPSWGYLLRGDFHNHHQMLEMILQMGVIGGLVYIMPFYFSLKGINNDNALFRILSLGIVICIQSLWFPYAIFMPSTILYFVLCVQNRKFPLTFYQNLYMSIRYLAVSLCLCAGGLRLLYVFYYDGHLYGQHYVSTNKTAQKIVRSAHRGRNVTGILQPASEHWNARMNPHDSQSLEEFTNTPNPSLCLLEGVHKSLESLSLREGRLSQETESLWQDVYHEIRTRMPRRTDLQMGYLYYLLNYFPEKFESEHLRFISQAKSQNKTLKNDPLISYLHAKILQKKGNDLGFHREFKRAFKLGLKKWIPLDESVVAHMEKNSH